MITSDAPPNGDTPDDDARSGVLLAIGLPPMVALRLAEGRTLREIGADGIADGLAAHPGARAGCPLIGADFDALDVITALSGQKFRGILLVACPPLPDPAMVLRELGRAGRGMAIRLVTI